MLSKLFRHTRKCCRVSPSIFYPVALLLGITANVEVFASISLSAVDAGGYHTCGVTTLGSVVCWGYNGDGRATPPSGTFTQVSAGGSHTCGVTTQGSVACWGHNSNGQATPPSGTFTQVSAGSSHTCGMTTQGSVACWGDNRYGQATPPSGTFTQVSAGRGHSCGVTTDGSVACWGDNRSGQATPPSGTFTQVSAGWEHTCGVTTQGSVACWGRDNYGQATPPGGTFTQVSAGYSHTCGVTTQGSVACWGSSNGDGQATPPSGTFTQVSAGSSHTCGMTTQGSVACWGSNYYGQATPPEPGRLQLTLANETVYENAGSITLYVSRTGGSDGSVSVNYATSNGTATAGSDYGAQSGTLSWPDGNTSNQTITVTILNNKVFEDPKTFSVSLSNATAGAIIEQPSLATVTINDDGDPIADFSLSRQSGNPPLDVTFNASASSDPNGRIVDYHWSINNQTLHGMIVAFQFEKAGEYPVTLTVTDNDGFSDSLEKTVSVTDRPPTAAFTLSPQQGPPPLKVTLNGSTSTDPDGPIATYSWLINGQTLSGQTISYTFTAVGEYPIKLTVTDSQGQTDSIQKTVKVSNNLIYSLTVSKSGLGSGTVSSSQTGINCGNDCSESYAHGGSVTLTASPTLGSTFAGWSGACSGTGNCTVTMTQAQNVTATFNLQVASYPTAAFTLSPQSGIPPLDVIFDASVSSDPNGSVVSYHWSINNQTLHGMIVAFQFEKAGEYPVTLTVTDNDGFSDSLEKTVSVTDQPPTAAFTLSPQQGSPPLKVTLNGSTSTDPDGPIATYTWLINGQTLSDQTISYTLTAVGEYPIKLTVTDSQGQTDSIQKTVKVSNNQPFSDGISNRRRECHR